MLYFSTPLCYTICMAKSDVRTLSTRIMDLAYIRNGDITYTDESVILACLLHAQSRKGRGSKDMIEVRKIMKDKNLTE